MFALGFALGELKLRKCLRQIGKRLEKALSITSGERGTIIGLSTGGAMLAAGGLSAAGSLGAAGIAAANQPGGMEQGYDVVTMPQYSFTEPRLRLASDYLTQNINRMSQGQYPAWYDKASPVMREGMMRGLNQATYGKPGQRQGTMQQASDMGAITGIGPKATWAQGQKVMSDYMDKSKQIDEYLTSLGVNIMQGEEQTYLQGMLNMPKGPDSTVVNKMGGAYGNQQGSPWQSLGQNLAGQDWSKIFQGGSNLQGMNSYGYSTNPAYTASGYDPVGMSGWSPSASPYQGMNWNQYQTMTGTGSQYGVVDTPYA